MQDLIFRQPVKKYEYISLPLNLMNHFFSEIQSQQLKNQAHYKSLLLFYFGEFIILAFEKGYIKYFNRWMQKSDKINLSSLKKYLISCYSSITQQRILLSSIS